MNMQDYHPQGFTTENQEQELDNITLLELEQLELELYLAERLPKETITASKRG